MKKNLATMFTGLLLLVLGLYSIYAWGYKEILLLQGFSIIGTVLGSIFLLYPLLLKSMKNEAKKNPHSFSLKTRLQAGGAMICLFMFIAVLIYVWIEGDKRVERILATGSSNFTTGKVSEVDIRPHQSKYDLHFPHIIIQYTAAGKQIVRRFTQHPEMYFVGQVINIKYSVEFPDMFAIVDEYSLGNKTMIK